MDKKFVEIIGIGEKTDNSVDLGYGFRGAKGKQDSAHIEADGVLLDFVNLDAEAEAPVKKEAEEWVVEEFCTWRVYDDVYDCGTKGEYVKHHSPEAIGPHIIVKEGHFHGVVLWTEQSGGNGWNGFHYGSYCFLMVDGAICGNNANYCGFSGEDKDDKSNYTYLLKKKEEARAPYSKKWDV